jgi:hypothetical protein
MIFFSMSKVTKFIVWIRVLFHSFSTIFNNSYVKNPAIKINAVLNEFKKNNDDLFYLSYIIRIIINFILNNIFIFFTNLLFFKN